MCTAQTVARCGLQNLATGDIKQGVGKQFHGNQLHLFFFRPTNWQPARCFACTGSKRAPELSQRHAFACADNKQGVEANISLSTATG